MSFSYLTEKKQPSNLVELCLGAALKYNKPDALNSKRGSEWHSIGASEFAQRVVNVASGLKELGIQAGDRIALLSENRPEWSIVDLAIAAVGAVNVPIYTTQAVEQIKFILEDSSARVVFISGRRIYGHAAAAIESVTNIERVIFFEKELPQSRENGLLLQELESAGAMRVSSAPEDFQSFADQVGPDDLATIIYTSGTTGEPKGVMLNHQSFISNVQSIARTLPISANDIALSVLPLSHIFERTVFYVFCWSGVSVYYSASFDQVGEHLKEVRPTIMTAVPRLFEKVYHRIVKKGLSQEGFKKKVFTWALDVGIRYATARDKRTFISPALRIKQAAASRLVFSKWREGVGGRIRYFVSGGAAISPTLSYAFLAAGLPILQGFGMTETCVVSANRPQDNCVGSVGLPFPGIEVRIAEDGEILVRGENVMKGYFKHPDTDKEVFEDGWFKTGDVGRIDDRGHLYITDRKKDLFKLSNGKYIAPQLIESLIKESEFVNQVVVIGAGRKHPAALIVPDWDSLNDALAGNGRKPTRDERSRDPETIRIIQKEVTALTAGLNDYERVRKIAVLPEEFSIDRGELTPTLKVKRRVIDDKFRQVIDELYR